MKTIVESFEKASDVRKMFDVVKDAVSLTLNQSRAGLDLGLADLGNGERQLLSAFYPIESNIIVVNKTPIRRIMNTRPELMKPYLFVILLHEYLHSLGYINENDTRRLTYSIVAELFGNDHIATKMALDLRKFFPYLLYPGGHPAGKNMEVIELDDIDYIG